MGDDLQQLLAEAKAKRKSIAQQPNLSNRTAVLKAKLLDLGECPWQCFANSAPRDTKKTKTICATQWHQRQHFLNLHIFIPPYANLINLARSQD